MYISFERTGGFAGLRLSTSFDSQSLGNDDLILLEQEVNQADFFNLPGQMLEHAGGVDRFEYQISIDWNERRHTIVVSEAAISDSLRPLVEHLERIMRIRMRRNN